MDDLKAYISIPSVSRNRGVIHADFSNIIEFEILYVLFERFFIQLGAPNKIIYLLDIINIFLLLKIIKSRNWNHFKGMIATYVLLIGVSIIVAFSNYLEWNSNPIYTIIELRNILRFLIFFIACVSLLTENSCIRIYNILIIYFFINALMIFYEYLTFHPVGIWTRGDYLNGFFGMSVGGNTFVNVSLLVVVSYLLSSWSKGIVSTKLFAISLVISLMISALIELKAFFLEFIILYIWYLVKKKKRKKEIQINILIIVLVILISYIGLQIMYKEYPWFRDTMSFSGMVSSVLDKGGYTSSGDLNRFTGVFTIANTIFNKDIVKILFGIGAGNASAFTVNGSSTKFFQIYENTHYNWFSGTFMFAQSGVVGLVLYLYSFLYLLRKKKQETVFKLNSQIMCIMTLFLIFYGEALKTDAGYLVYFAIASGFVKYSKNRKVIREKI